MGACYIVGMRIVSRKSIREFWEANPQAEESLRAWAGEARQSVWESPADVKRSYRSASIIANNRAVFNICGNKYRLIVGMDYEKSACFIKFIDTHKEYDKIDAATVEMRKK